MFVNSLFNDFLLKNGFEVWNGESSRDIIGLEFNYGTRSYKDEIEHLRKLSKNAKKELRKAEIKKDTYLIEKEKNKLAKSDELLSIARRNSSKYTHMNTSELRAYVYKNGVDVTYISHNKKGEIIKKEKIHYKMLYRSTGKAKKGSCMFIRDSLYEKALDYIRMGIKLPDKNADIVGISAYSPLIDSGIVGRIKINPRNILVLKDIDKFFETNIISVELNEDKQCIAKKINNYKLKNTIFDGQALIDSSIFPKWGNGYVLLRQHFCKMAAFNTNIQLFFQDYCRDNCLDYNTQTVTDIFGNKHYLKDIKLITTDSAMKWLKTEGITYDYWCKKVSENGNYFGVVKTSHPSKMGEYQKMSYQMVNSLDMSIMKEVCSDTVDYINNLKSNEKAFHEYLRNNSNFSNDYEVLLALCEHNPNFIYSSYYRERKKSILMSLSLRMKSGEIIQKAENLTVVGSPYAMLLYGACGDTSVVDSDNTFCYEEGTIQCYTERFNNDEHLAFFRSPFNSKNNLLYLHNVYDERFKKYFSFGKQIIAINMIGTDAQERANGMDMDSDFGLTTNQKDIVEHARNCYINYPTIVNNIPKDTNKYDNTPESFALMDNKLSESQRDIGESSNVAQIGQSYACHFGDDRFNDYVAILAVLAQIAIDSAKRLFDVNVSAEIARIKKEMDIDKNKYPKFWEIIKKDFNKSNINKSINCPMNYLSDLEFKKFRSPVATIPMSEFFIKHEFEEGNTNRRKSIKVEKLIENYALKLYEVQLNDAERENNLLLRSDFDKLISDIRATYISRNYKGLMSWLINRTFMISSGVKGKSCMKQTVMKQNRAILLKVLFEINKEMFLDCFSREIGTISSN